MKYDNHGKTVEKRFHPPYPAFGGHVSRLSHLCRHLFQMVKRVVSNEDLDWNDKYEYMKLIRAQLSNHEQAMLFWGALWLKNPTWWEDFSNLDQDGNPSRYFLDYALIKNIPFNLTDEIGPDVQKAFVKRMRKGEVYKKGNKVLKFEEKMDWLFEWRKW